MHKIKSLLQRTFQQSRQQQIRQYNKLKCQPFIYFMTEEYLQPQSSFFLKCINLVESLIAVGDVQESIQIIEALLEVNPKHPGLHKKKAIALIKDNQFQSALKALDASIKNSSNQEKSECYLYKADLLYSLQKYPESLEIYQLLLKHNSHRPQIIYRKGLCILAQQKFKSATKIFNEVLTLDPNYSQCYIMNAHSLFMQQKYHKALKYLKKVTLNNNFQNTDVIYLKASCLYNVRRYAQCEKLLKRILQIDFGHVESKVLCSIVKHKINSIRKPNRIQRLKRENV